MPVWLRLSIAGAATLLVGMGIGRFSYSPMIPALVEAGQFSAPQAGYIGASNFFGYLVGTLAAPLMRARWGEVRSLHISLVVALVCLVASILPWGFAWLAFWRFLVGAMVGVMMIYSLAIVTRHAPAERLGAATGIVFTGVGVGILFTATLLPWLLQTGIAAAWAGVALIGAIGVGTAFWGWRAAGPDIVAPHAEMKLPPASRVEWTPAVIALVAARTAFSLGLIPHSIFWVDYLVRGLGRDIAFGGFHWALFGVGAITGTYLWGRLADRIGFRAGLVLVFAALALGVTLPVIHSAGWALVLSSLVVGAQPGFSAIIAGRTHQLIGAAMMAQVWRWMALVSGIGQALGGYAYVTLFAYTESYMPIFLAGGTAMALGSMIALALGSYRSGMTPRERAP
jgi:predicted MFS family arabinose efflux permease